jgi:hypothetical protein
MPETESRLENMLSKQEIQDVLMRYGRGVDQALANPGVCW